MHPDSAVAARINKSQYLFLRSLKEQGANQLVLIVEEAVVNEAKRGTIESADLPEGLAFLLGNAAPIESVEGSLAFRIYWKRYAGFLVTEECVGSCGNYDDEAFEGNRLRIYSKSHFLGHLSRDTGAYGKPLLHYKIVCEDHLIDVASEEPPEIEVVQTTAQNWIQ
jgi:hypothetical protein